MAQKIKPRKVSGTSVDGFSETIMFEVLACGNVEDNNNKFYCIELQKNPSTGAFRLFTHYGRIGKTNVYEIRDNVDGAEVFDQATLEAEYNKILKKKKRVSKSKANYETVDTQSPSVGSDNIRNTVSTCSTGSSSKGEVSIIKAFSDVDIKTLVRKVWEENIHNITNLTTMNVSSSGISSPLGPLTLPHIQNAMSVLTSIKDEYNGNASDLAALNSKYYSMIPHPFGHKIPADAMIDDDNKFMVEFDLLEQMKATLQVTDKSNDSDDIIELPFAIQKLSCNSKEHKDIEKVYVGSRASCHRHLSSWNVKNIYKLDHGGMSKAYENLDERFKEDEYDLFHGSRACNILSIMMNGLMVPPKTAGHVTGRMFGDGIYGASASTKALNYATGYWAGGVRNKHREAYMFVVRFAMGKIYDPTRPMYNGPPSVYDSIWARKERTSLANDEFIVYRTDQAKITHILQLQEG